MENLFFTKICNISPIAMGLSVCVSACLSVCVGVSECVCVCVSVCLFVCVSIIIVSTCHALAKIESVKNKVRKIWHLATNEINAKIVLHDLELLFEGRNLKLSYLRKGKGLCKNLWEPFVELTFVIECG